MSTLEWSRPKPKSSIYWAQNSPEVELKPLIGPSSPPGVSNSTQGLSEQALHLAFGAPSQPSILPTPLQNPFPKPLVPQPYQPVFLQQPQQPPPYQPVFLQQPQQPPPYQPVAIQQQQPQPFSPSSMYPEPFSVPHSVGTTSLGPPQLSNQTSTWPSPLEGTSPLFSTVPQATPPKLYPTLFVPPNDGKKETNKNSPHKKKISENINKKEKKKKEKQEQKTSKKGNKEQKKEQMTDIKGNKTQAKEQMTDIKGNKTQTKEQTFTKRCIKCQQYYMPGKEESETPCHYHPGSYRRAYSSPLLAGASIQYWSCCRAAARDQPGCVMEQHKEDPKVTQIQLHIQKAMEVTPVSPPLVSPSEQQGPQVGVLIDIPQDKDRNKEEEALPEKNETKLNNVIRHYVTEADTLVGLSLRYGVPVKSIRQLNRMPTDDIQGFSRLYIPKKGYNLSVIEIDDDDDKVGPPQDLTDAEKVLFEKRMMARMRTTAGVSQEEALYYLSLHGFSYAQAMAEYKEDMEFERTTPFRPSKKCK